MRTGSKGVIVSSIKVQVRSENNGSKSASDALSGLMDAMNEFRAATAELRHKVQLSRVYLERAGVDSLTNEIDDYDSMIANYSAEVADAYANVTIAIPKETPAEIVKPAKETANLLSSLLGRANEAAQQVADKIKTEKPAAPVTTQPPSGGLTDMLKALKEGNKPSGPSGGSL